MIDFFLSFALRKEQCLLFLECDVVVCITHFPSLRSVVASRRNLRQILNFFLFPSIKHDTIILFLLKYSEVLFFPVILGIFLFPAVYIWTTFLKNSLFYFISI